MHDLMVRCIILFFFINILMLSTLGITDQNNAIVIHNVQIFDGEQIIDELSVVVIRDGKIYDVRNDLPDLPESVFIDGNGKTLLPGLVDSHVHVYGEVLEPSLVFGVTTVFDMFSQPAMAAQLRKEQHETGAVSRADLFSAGILVTAPGGHGTQYGLQIPTIDDPDAAAAFVEDRIAEGSDYIKIVYDDGSSYGIDFNTLDKETLAAVIREAHRRDKLAVVHISELEDARDAIEAGADGLVHIFHDRAADQAFIDLVVENDAFIIPTLTVLESAGGTPSGASLLEDPRLEPYILVDERQNLQTAFPVGDYPDTSFHNTLENTRMLHEAGVRILAGSDAPNPGTAHGVSIHRELELLVQAGLSPLEALRSATSVPAQAFGLNNRGRILPGYRADLLLVNGNPIDDITATRDIVAVWKLGVQADRERQKERVEQQLADLERAEEPPPGLDDGLISDFEDGTISAAFGSEWDESTDAMMGGNSTVEMEIVEGGAPESNYSLLLSGRIDDSFQNPWAGAMFFPGFEPMWPANLSSKSGISFWARGDGRTFSILFFTQSRGMMPVFQSFTAGDEWERFYFDFSSFDCIDGSDVTGIVFSAGLPEGPFELQLDKISLE